ncbi:MAG: bifunctional alpha,alpha-trehalose-phosphate synthase (UDP-forming)/trehalose-phosphatase, partial [Gemmatimonadota bacterium]
MIEPASPSRVGDQRRVLLVANRLAVTVQAGPDGSELGPSPGGLASGLTSVHSRGHTLWIGWPGGAAAADPTAGALLAAERYVPVELTAEEVNRYYDGYANGVLWPVLHYLTNYLPLSNDDWDAYEAVNRRFAEAVAAVYRPGDLVWVHDYQLLRVPFHLRAMIPDAKIGFFLHVPFPAADVFRILPRRRELLDGVLGADLIGFHTSDYLRHFVGAVRQVLGDPVRVDEVDHAGRVVRLGVFPLGVDRDEWAEVEAAPGVPPLPGRGLTTLLAIDRLDYTKGMSHRLAAFERLLERHPELSGRVRLLAVAAPSRDSVVAYQEHRTAVDQLIGRIQGRFATPEWVPVHYMVRAFTRAEVAALYRLADVMLVTPLRDGMNLVAKEFVACRSDGDGVLVLSEFAGAVAELDGALVVNPYDIEATAAAYERAILMEPAERRSRMARLRNQLAGTSPNEWSERFLRALVGTGNPGPGAGQPETPGQLALALERATTAGRLVLLLDYDGTLVEIQASPERAIPDSELLDLLAKLVKRRRTEVHIVSGRSRGFLQRWLGSLGLHLHAEHGAFSRSAKGREWENHVTIDPAWQPEVRALATWFARRTPGAAVEFKESGLTWHWR